MINGNEPPIGGMTLREAALKMNVSLRCVERARFVMRYGIPDLDTEIMAGRLNLLQAERIARLPREQQAGALQEALQPQSRKRPKWELQHDQDKLVATINNMARRWTEQDRSTMALLLHDLGRQLAE